MIYNIRPVLGIGKVGTTAALFRGGIFGPKYFSANFDDFVGTIPIMLL